jgi:hypothetical protein
MPDVPIAQRTPAHEIAVAGREVVERDRSVAVPRERLAGVSADITSAADDQDGFAHQRPPTRKICDREGAFVLIRPSASRDLK